MVSSRKNQDQGRVYAVTASWRTIDEKLVEAIGNDLVPVIDKENNAVFRFGGALGGDWIGTDIVLRRANPNKQLEIFLPTPLKIYLEYYKRRVEEGEITSHQYNMLEEQLGYVKQLFPNAITESRSFTEVTQQSYFARNKRVIRGDSKHKPIDVLFAYQVNDSEGVWQAYQEALRRDVLEVHLRRPKIKETKKNQSHKILDYALNGFSLNEPINILETYPLLRDSGNLDITLP
ncbi:hypothetical protein CMI38_03425 [Candidatus Pacearchaeota archaeon]|jgi:hypothetical protein|nr:hypothetical protein [Candidatus Pacearchaeota archaeon]|tara:strand:+ start:10180 stop:10878 length:699 start_codon:yes stop_codon:yes gene_type:complete